MKKKPRVRINLARPRAKPPSPPSPPPVEWLYLHEVLVLHEWSWRTCRTPESCGLREHIRAELVRRPF